MKPERWRRVEELYDSALEREESERPEFLREACGGDAELLRQVESLLACEQRRRASEIAATVPSHIVG